MATVINLKNKQRVRRSDLLPRATRFFHVEHEGWFLHTREGVQGPFASLPEAELFLSVLVNGGDKQPPSII